MSDIKNKTIKLLEMILENICTALDLAIDVEKVDLKNKTA